VSTIFIHYVLNGYTLRQHINYYRGEQCCKDHKDVENLFQVDIENLNVKNNSLQYSQTSLSVTLDKVQSYGQSEKNTLPSNNYHNRNNRQDGPI